MSESKTGSTQMGETPIRRLVLTMALPIVLSMLIQALYNIVDSIFVAQIGEQALAAVSFAFPVQMVIISVSVGTSVGVNSLMSRYLGQKNLELANASVKNGILLAILSWLLFVLFGIFGSRLFMKAFTNDVVLIDLGVDYISICSIFSIGVFVQIIMERIMQATGNPVYSMLLQGAGALVNLILDPVLIFGWFGLPQMGVAGAAVATVIGQIVAMSLGIWLTNHRISEINLNLKGYRPSGRIIQNIYAVGIPAMFVQGMAAILTVGMNVVLGGFSELAVSVFGVYYKLQNFVFMGILGLTNALIPIVGYNFGAKQPRRITGAIRFTLLLSIGVTVVATLLFQLIPVSLLQMFQAQQDMLAIGVPTLRIISSSFVFAGVSMILCSAFQAMGNGMLSLWITLGRQLVIVLPLAFWFASEWGLTATWLAFPISEIICMAASLIAMKYLYQKQIVPLSEKL